MKTNQKVLLLAGFAALFSLSGCRTMYMPNAHNVPLLEEGGDFRLSVDPSNLQMAYAVTDNVGVIVNGQYNASEWMITKGAEGGTKTRFESELSTAEIGLGCFNPWKQNCIFETYVGVGTGRSMYNRTEISDNIEMISNKFVANQTRIFAQSNLGYTKNGFDFIVSLRYLGLKFALVDTTTNFFKTSAAVMSNGNDKVERDNLRNINKPYYSFIEPSITLRYGKEKIKLFSKPFSAKLYLQMVMSNKLNRDPLVYRNMTTNIGAQIGFNSNNSHHKRKHKKSRH